MTTWVKVKIMLWCLKRVRGFKRLWHTWSFKKKGVLPQYIELAKTAAEFDPFDLKAEIRDGFFCLVIYPGFLSEEETEFYLSRISVKCDKCKGKAREIVAVRFIAPVGRELDIYVEFESRPAVYGSPYRLAEQRHSHRARFGEKLDQDAAAHWARCKRQQLKEASNYRYALQL